MSVLLQPYLESPPGEGITACASYCDKTLEAECCVEKEFTFLQV